MNEKMRNLLATTCNAGIEICILPCKVVVCMFTFNICNTGMGALSDMYTQSLRTAGPRAEGVRIRAEHEYLYYTYYVTLS